jgi:hypothetical protein
MNRNSTPPTMLALNRRSRSASTASPQDPETTPFVAWRRVCCSSPFGSAQCSPSTTRSPTGASCRHLRALGAAVQEGPNWGATE